MYRPSARVRRDSIAIAVLGLVALCVTGQADAYSSLAAAPDELRKTLALGSAPTSQADADRVAIDNCKIIAEALQVGYAAGSCRVVHRQTAPGHGAVACDDRICASGYGAGEPAARTDALANCKANSKAPDKCGAASFAWRDDKVSTKEQLEAAEQAKTSQAVVSESPAAIYGLLVGKTMLAMIPSCAGEPLAKGQPYCHNVHSYSGEDPDNVMYRALQLRQIDVVINSQMFDVSTLYHNVIFGTFSWAETWVTSDGVVRRIKIVTGLPAANAVKANLISKFGNPSNEGMMDWIDNRTGQTLFQTPTASWYAKDYQVYFNAKAPIAFDNLNGDRGSVEIYDMNLLQRIWDYDKKQKPAQKKM